MDHQLGFTKDSSKHHIQRHNFGDLDCQGNGPKVGDCWASSRWAINHWLLYLVEGIMGSVTEFNPFPFCTYGKCVCNINQRLANLQAKESIIKFLMGLNESFS